MSTPESKVKNRIKCLLKQYGAYWHMPVQNGLGAPSLDFIGCHRGEFYAIEAKAGNKQPTPRQAQTMRTITAAGGRCFLVNEVTGTEELESWLKTVGEA